MNKTTKSYERESVGFIDWLNVPSYVYPPGTIMPETCYYCQSKLEPQDNASGRCEWCRMPWGALGTSTGAPSATA